MKALDREGVCFICRRRDGGLAVHRGRFEDVTVGWMCERCSKAGLGWPALEGSEAAFDAIEQRALAWAGAQAGAYLDTLGQYDVTELHPDEWLHVVRTVVEAFGAGIRREIMSAAEQGQL